MSDDLTNQNANGDVTRRAEINRTNAQNSTGPRTEAGKQRSSVNALRHGLTGQTVVLPSDDLAAYERHCKEFLDQYRTGHHRTIEDCRHRKRPSAHSARHGESLPRTP